MNRSFHPDPAATRAQLGFSQAHFAAMCGISVKTLQNWEQRRTKPNGSARSLLRLIAAHPDAARALFQEA